VDVSLLRLYLLRGLYLLIALGEGSQVWPVILQHSRPWDFWHGVSVSFLGALTLLALLGVRYPVKMLPLLMYEFTWKLIWVLAVWLPLALAHRVDADTAGNIFGIVMGVVLVPLVVPWGYLWRNYVIGPGDRWFRGR
jgi:hypothetical protein